MNRPQLIRGLRIAVSTVFGILCVLVIVLWVRSYFQRDLLSGPISNAQKLTIMSMRGVVSFRKITDSKIGSRGWRVSSHSVDELLSGYARLSDYSLEYVKNGPRDYSRCFLVVPHWLGVLTSATIAVLPWIPWRFSLRALLIVTTLVAVVLGLVVYASNGH